jgi:hypothetical protein
VTRTRVRLALAVAVVSVLGAGSVAAAGGGGDVKETLTGYEEVPALSTPGVGEFKADISRSRDEIRYRLRFDGLESNATQAHIHFENATNNGPIVAFLCTNLGNAPGVQACPAGGGTITGTIRPADVSATPSSTGAIAAGIGVGEFDEFVRAIRAGATYVNVHSVNRAGGEIRAQLESDGHGRGHDDH